MSRKKVAIRRTPKRQHAPNTMADVLEQMQHSGSIHFVKALPKTALPNPTDKQNPKLSLPLQFLEENGDKFEELVTLRAQTSRGRSSKSWSVRVCVASTLKVQIVGGWTAFVTDNGLKRGDFVIFLLREDARSEFEVHIFRGPRGAPYFPDTEERQRSDEEEEDEEEEEEEEENTHNRTRFVSLNQILSRDTVREPGNSAPLRRTGNLHVHHPRFTKRLTASNIGRSSGELNTAQFEFPAHFVRTHGDRIYDAVKLQGIHEDSLNYVVNCHRRPRNFIKVYFTPTEWSRFVYDNGLKEGHELQFSLMADSYFLVRKVSG